MTIKGTIESIEYSNVAGHEKKMLTISKVPISRMVSSDVKSLKRKERVLLNIVDEGQLKCTITGTIESIQEFKTGKFTDRILTIIPDHRQKAMIEFRGKRKDLLSGYKEGDDVEVEVLIESKVSKSSGNIYNNLVAVSIAKDRRFDHNLNP